MSETVTISSGTVFEIPLTPQAQSFRIILSNTAYYFTLVYLDCDMGGWSLTISDQDSNVLVAGLPLVTGVDLLYQLQYLGIGSGGSLIAQTDGVPYFVPNYTNLGTTAHLYFVSAG